MVPAGFVGVKRALHMEDGFGALRAGDPARREGAPLARPLDPVAYRLVAAARAEKIAVHRMQGAVFHRGTGGGQGLAQIGQFRVAECGGAAPLYHHRLNSRRSSGLPEAV